MTEQTTLTPIEAINEFYRLKDKYESTYYEKYIKPIIKSNKSKKEKRVEYSKLPKHECINCKRNVGTIFTINVNKDELIRVFTAKCGDITEPCPLNIQINYSNREQMDKIIREGLKEIEKIKLEIIKEKNNSLFFKTQVVEKFNKLTEDLKLETQDIGFIIETNILRNDNPEKTVLLKQTVDKFGTELVLPFKQMIKDFDETNNELKLDQAVNFYQNEIIPKLKEILSLKYSVSIVEYDEVYNNYKLIQLPNSVENSEFYYKVDDKIIKFIRGIEKKNKKTKKDDSKFKPKNKTKKIKPIANLVLEDEEDIIEPLLEEEKEKQLKSKYTEELNRKPIFDESGNVSWNDEKYNKRWKAIPYKFKNILVQDHDWLEDYMNNCVKLREDGKQCTLFLPKQTQFPPIKGSDDKYDF